MSGPLWQPSAERIAATNLVRFMDRVNRKWGLRLDDYEPLWAWSVAEKEQFWTSLWDFCEVIAETRGPRVAVDIDKLPGARYFPDARLNFAENLLRPGRRRVADDSPAIVFRGEGGAMRTLPWAELEQAVSRLAQAMRALGLAPGDRVAAYVPNLPETIDRDAGRDLDRRRLVVVLAGFRRPWGARPLRPDRAEAVDRRRRLHLQRQDLQQRWTNCPISSPSCRASSG